MPLGKRKATRQLQALVKRRLALNINRRRMARKRVARSRVFPSRDVHSFKRWAATNTVLGSTTSTDGKGFAETFTMNKLPSYTEFDTLYDRYMLTTVVVRVQLISNPDANSWMGGNVTSNAQNWYPKFWYYPDYDDDTAPTSFDEVKQISKVKHFVLRPNKEYKIVIRPAINMQTYRTSTTTGYAPKWNQWIDIAQTDVPHFGLKYWIDNNGIDPADSMPVTVRLERLYYFKCKDVR